MRGIAALARTLEWGVLEGGRRLSTFLQSAGRTDRHGDGRRNPVGRDGKATRRDGKATRRDGKPTGRDGKATRRDGKATRRPGGGTACALESSGGQIGAGRREAADLKMVSATGSELQAVIGGPEARA